MSVDEGDCDLRGWCFVDSVGVSVSADVCSQEILLIREEETDSSEEVVFGGSTDIPQVTDEAGGSESVSCRAETSDTNKEEEENNCSISDLRSQSHQVESPDMDKIDDENNSSFSDVKSEDDNNSSFSELKSQSHAKPINMDQSRDENNTSTSELKCQSSQVLSVPEVSCGCHYTDDSASECNCGSDTSSETTDPPEETDLIQQYKEEEDGKKGKIHLKRENSSSSDISVLDVKDDTIVCEVKENKVFPLHYNLPSNVVNPQEMIQRVIDAQLSSSATTHADSLTQTPHFQIIEDYEHELEPESRPWRFFGRELFSFQAGSCFAFFLILLVSYYGDQETAGVGLANIQRNILACLAKQNLDAQLNNITVIPKVCKSETGDYHYMVQKHLRSKSVQTVLSYAQKMLVENETADVSVLVSENISDVNMKFVIEHLEHIKVLPKMISKPVTKGLQNNEDIVAKYTVMVKEKEAIMREMHEAVKNLTRLNEDLRNHVLFLSKQTNKSSESGISFKSPDVHAKANSELGNDFKEKMHHLLRQNEILKNEIEELRNAQIEQNNSVGKKKSSYSEEKNEGSDFASNHKSEGMNIDKEVGNLARQIDMLQGSLEDKFPEIKKLHNLIKEFSEQLNGQKITNGEDSQNSDEWSWKKLKKNMENFIKKTQAEFKETLGGYKSIDVIEVLSDCIQESRKHAEKSLEFFTYYMKALQKKSHQIITKEIPELSMKKTVEGVWSMWGSLQNKWTSMRKKFADTCSNKNSKKKDEAQEVEVEIEGENESMKNGESMEDDNSNDDDDGMTEKKWHNGNWLFKRAESREKERSANVPINWYLCRDMMRRRERKWNSRSHGEL